MYWLSAFGEQLSQKPGNGNLLALKEMSRDNPARENCLLLTFHFEQ